MSCTLNKHIVIVTSEFPPLPGGIGNHAYHLALQLSKNHYIVKVITDQRSESYEEELRFDKNLPFSVTRIRLKKWRFIMYFKRLIKTFKLIKHYDFVIATGKFSLWNVAFCNFFLKRPSLAVIHGSEVNLKSRLLRTTTNMSLKRFTNIVAVSHYTRSLVLDLGKPIKVIPNGINYEAWTFDGFESMTLAGSPVLTTVGRVSTRKGQLEVIKLLPKLIADFPEIHYHCIGIPTEAEYFKAIARSLSVESHVTFHGAVSEHYLKAVLLATDVFIMMSTESQTGDVEGFGIAILEANAMGVPAIGSRGCGIEDTINDGVTGFLVEPGHYTALRDSLRTILNERDNLSSNARKWAYDHRWESVIQDYIKFLSQNDED
ncbi:glycosyltransferase [Hanstruepera neustonica]|uniref:Glycosyltransferase n=1 Tax=Hanstruepera neustonica TaxID=1445657 RepID=A0A2K1DVP2_9FLAO|nr:glycosyltransferase family 4 protein [Hanstruepera neustonica]PNQ72092.1 glycosyltransferase [Hanstruepera neustonica]